jgi:hypothetical protein
MRQEEHRRHRKSLRTVKPLISINPPHDYAFLATNPKRMQMQQCSHAITKSISGKYSWPTQI